MSSFDIAPDCKVARRIEWIQNGQQGGVDVTEDDLVFVTNGSLVENSAWGDHHTPAKFDPIVHDGGSWHLWRNIAVQDPLFWKARQVLYQAGGVTVGLRFDHDDRHTDTHLH